MMRYLALLALAVAACSPDAGNDATPANAAAPGDVAAPGFTPAASHAAADVPPRPGVLKTFRDWTVGCDNGGVCTMASLGPEGGDFPTVTMSMSREAGPDGAWKVEFDGQDEGVASVAIDGRPVAAAGASFTGASAAAVAAAMANGTSLAARDARGRTLATLSLAGASAALRYIDAQQGRAGTQTAVVAKGPGAASTVPHAPALPVVVALKPSGTAARPTAQQVAAMRRAAGCDTQGFAASSEPEGHALGGGATLVFVPCSVGAYNISSALFILADGRVAPALADVPTGFAGDSDLSQPAQVVNGDFEDGLVTSYSKGRGLGDCGVSQALAWDGHRLRLVEQAMMSECRGNTDTITTWRARVERR